MNCQPIGFVKSPVKDGMDSSWGAIESELHIEDQFGAGLTGVNSFSHIMVIFEMHRSSWDPATDLVRRPQGRSDMPLIGIFAQRAKHRPNPIGVTSVRLLGVEGNVIKVRGLDAIDGSPILDVRPYFAKYDMVAGSHAPEWVERLMSGYF